MKIMDILELFQILAGIFALSYFSFKCGSRSSEDKILGRLYDEERHAQTPDHISAVRSIIYIVESLIGRGKDDGC